MRAGIHKKKRLRLSNRILRREKRDKRAQEGTRRHAAPHNESCLTQALLLCVLFSSLTLCLFYGMVLSVRWQSLFSTGRHRTSGKPRASGSERLSGQPHDIKRTVFKNLQFAHKVCVCVCDALQGVKGALGDPGLPGPTGIRGEFGERVRTTCVWSVSCVTAAILTPQRLAQGVSDDTN